MKTSHVERMIFIALLGHRRTSPWLALLPKAHPLSLSVLWTEYMSMTVIFHDIFR